MAGRLYAAPHDPGGLTLPMLPGVRGDAEFVGANKEYRPVLRRWWGRRDRPGKYVMFIGMNPSTARADVDDRTIRREIQFTEQFNLTSYVKCNVMDYRATHPNDLLSIKQPRSPNNLPRLLDLAMEAEYVVAAWGALLKPLQKYAFETERKLLSYEVPLYCLGTTAQGLPRHPLYVESSVCFQRYIPQGQSL